MFADFLGSSSSSGKQQQVSVLQNVFVANEG
jgi:hypothetical protein